MRSAIYQDRNGSIQIGGSDVGERGQLSKGAGALGIMPFRGRSLKEKGIQGSSHKAAV